MLIEQQAKQPQGVEHGNASRSIQLRSRPAFLFQTLYILCAFYGRVLLTTTTTTYNSLKSRSIHGTKMVSILAFNLY